MMKRLLVPVALVALAGCSSDIDDLKQFVRDSDKRVPPKIDPLPAVKPFEPFTYEGFDLPDPFKPRKLTGPKTGAQGGVAPDLNRRKEPLEAFPLEQLKMVGTLSQSNEVYALVRADTRARAEFYTRQVQNGARSPNEIRELEDMNPREGGDIYLTPANMLIDGKVPPDGSGGDAGGGKDGQAP